MKLERKYRIPFQPLYFPWTYSRAVMLGRRFYDFRKKAETRRYWAFDVRRMLFEDYHGILRRNSWVNEDGWTVFGTWREYTGSLWNNVMLILTPWRRPAMTLLQNFVNRNGGKLLYEDRNLARLRTRDTADTYYFALRLGPVRATLTRTAWKDCSGRSVNTYGTAISALMTGTATPELSKETVELGSWPCLTWAQCERAFSEMTEVAPELHWF